MAMIDMTTYIEHSGIRKARFGGYEPEDVRQAMLGLCGEYEQSLSRAEAAAHTAAQEAEALRRRCQTLLGQNQTLVAQNAKLAGQADRYARHHDTLDTQLSSLTQRNRSLTDQCAVLRMKNSDLTRENTELREQAEQADAALRVKGRELDEARQALAAEREELLADARREGDSLIAEARTQADQTIRDAELKAEAIDQTAREQAIAQARKLVQSASDETKEIQSAHRLRLEDLKRQVAVMEKRRTELLEYLSRMGGELRDIEALARQEAPGAALDEETPEHTPEPELDLSDSRVGAAASALRAARSEPENDLPAEPAEPARTTRVVGPDSLEDIAFTRTAGSRGADAGMTDAGTAETRQGLATKGPSPEFFDTGEETEEVPGAIFSYPILRQRGEPILLEDPPLRGPHTPVMPTLPQDDEDEEPSLPPAQRQAVPRPVNSAQSVETRRRKAIWAIQAIMRRRGEL